MDLDVLIINGCSILGNFGDSTSVEHSDGPKTNISCAPDGQDLLTSHRRPLLAILGYRDTAPMDSGGGDQIAKEMAQATILKTWATDLSRYARKWCEINA